MEAVYSTVLPTWSPADDEETYNGGVRLSRALQSPYSLA